MRYKLLGKSGLRVSEMCLGTMTFGTAWGWGADKETCAAQVDRFADLGGNFIDTSINYTDGESETILGELLEGRREQFVLATKYSLTKPGSTDPNSGGNSRKNMVQSVERSLQRLKTDHIDLYYLHMWDYLTPVEEVMRGLDDLVRSGKVVYIGISDSPAWIVSQANMLAELRGWAQFVGLQVPYSLLDRDLEWALLPMAKHWQMAVMPWGILESGILTGKFMKKPEEPTRLNPDELVIDERHQKIVETVQTIAQETGHSMAQVATNWVRQQQHKSLMIPILGARTLEQLDDSLGALEWELTAEQLETLGQVSQIRLGFPHGFLSGNRYIFGATRDQIDNHRR
jgi:aryl-alcohol dehydrogenase-like predicted oxidoreductase